MSNQIVVLGRLGKDAERGNAGSTAMLKFSVGDTVGFGEKKSTNWWNCVLFGKQAEGALADHLTKGKQVQVIGELKSREYEGKTYYDLNVSRIELVGGGDQQQSAPKPQQQAQPSYAQNPAPQPTAGGGTSNLDDDLPFAPVHWMEG